MAKKDERKADRYSKIPFVRRLDRMREQTLAVQRMQGYPEKAGPGAPVHCGELLPLLRGGKLRGYLGGAACHGQR